MNEVKILATTLTCINSYDEAHSALLNLIKIGVPEYITVNNVHTVVECALDKKYKGVINNSFLAFPDGKPLSIYAKLKGYKNVSRIFGPTFMEKTLEWGQKDGLKHYFFGSSEETLKQMNSNITEKYLKTKIDECFSLPLSRKVSNRENDSRKVFKGNYY